MYMAAADSGAKVPSIEMLNVYEPLSREMKFYESLVPTF